MPNLDIVKQEIVEAALDVIGPDSRAKAEKIEDRATAGFRARGWEVFTWDEISNLDDTPRIPEVDPQILKRK